MRVVITLIVTVLLVGCTGHSLDSRQPPAPSVEPKPAPPPAEKDQPSKPTTQEESASLDVGKPEPLGALQQVESAGRVAEPGAYLINVSSGELWQLGSATRSGLPVGQNQMLRLGPAGLDLIDLPSKQATRLLHQQVYEAAFGPKSGRLAFTVPAEDNTSLLYLATLDQEAKELTHVRSAGPKGRITGLQWSPDGGSLIWLYSAPGDARRQRAYRLDTADGSLTDLGEAHAVSWSADSRAVAIADAKGLHLVADETRSTNPSTASLPGMGYVLWGPGKTVLYGPPLPGLHRSHLLTMTSAQGQGLRTLAISFGPPQWSPQRDRFAYVSDGCTSGEWNLYVMTTAPGSRTRLTDSGTEIKRNLLWSPDGSMIAFSEGRLRLQKVEIDSTATQTLAETDAEGLGPLIPMAWSADGRYLIFILSRGAGGVC